MGNWHTDDISVVMERLATSSYGLNAEDAAARMLKYGSNKLDETKKKSVLKLFLSQFADLMIIILLVAAIVSGLAGDMTDAIIILVIVLLNAVIGFVQEYRAEQAVNALRRMATPLAMIRRDDVLIQVSSEELVPGDIVYVEAGNIMPADLRLIEVFNLRIEESTLTGESIAIDKIVAPLNDIGHSLADRVNMAFKGTLAIYGRGVGVVVATGMQTELGQIASMLETADSATPLQIRMGDFGKKLTWIVLMICLVLFATGIIRGESVLSMLLLSISLAVAAIPEALPALVTISLARGAKQLVAKNVLIRKLPAVETLGSVSFICSDKTGTLTQNKMTVTHIVHSENSVGAWQQSEMLCALMAVCNDVQTTNNEEQIGDPTEVALVVYVNNVPNGRKVAEWNQLLPRIGEFAFDSDRKCMTTLHIWQGRCLVITKGAVEVVTAKLNDNNAKDAIDKEVKNMAERGMRVLAFGYKWLPHMPENSTADEIEQGLTFAGLVGMIDPPRAEVKLSIAECKTAGIKPVMITGDHVVTATAIAKEIGLLDKGDKVVSGVALAAMSDEELEQEVEHISVYARMSPDQKLRIVRTLQQRGHFVAMTGDGVNDAPSLKVANIGVAMGITGTDVSKEAAHMILLDDNFSTIVVAVKEGRRIYGNIRKFVKYVMTCNSAEIMTLLIAPFLGLPMPLLPIHILWINLVSDGLPGLALSSEQAEKDIMKYPPRRSDDSLFSDGIGVHIIWVGMLMAAITLATQAIAIKLDDDHWQTMVFTVLSMAQLGHVFAIRSDNEYVYKKGIFRNLPLVWALLLTTALQIGVIYIPWANDVFKTQPLTLMEFCISIGVSAIVFHAVELEKWVRRRRAR